MRDHRARGAVGAAVALTLALAGAAAQAEAPFAFATTPGKLPKDVIPLLYDAHLVPDVAADTFRGRQRVEIEVLQPTRRIVLNAANLAIERAVLSGRGMPERVLTPSLDQEQETLAFELGAPLAPGRYTLALDFSGQINREGLSLIHI